MISRQEVLEELIYDKQLGLFFWKTQKKNAKQFSEAGCLNDVGYKRIGINKRSYYVHRLVWLCETGSFPNGILDHKNRNKTDNRFENLREVSFAENSQNIVTPHGKSKTGLRGVIYIEKLGKYQARICVNRKFKHLGLFSDAISASFAYLEAKKIYHPCFHT